LIAYPKFVAIIIYFNAEMDAFIDALGGISAGYSFNISGQVRWVCNEEYATLYSCE
jgi:hypothetical protein